MNNTTYNFNTFMSWLPELLLAIVILVVGYILAKVLENVTRKALKKARLDERVGIKKMRRKEKSGPLNALSEKSCSLGYYSSHS